MIGELLGRSSWHHLSQVVLAALVVEVAGPGVERLGTRDEGHSTQEKFAQCEQPVLERHH